MAESGWLLSEGSLFGSGGWEDQEHGTSKGWCCFNLWWKKMCIQKREKPGAASLPNSLTHRTSLGLQEWGPCTIRIDPDVWERHQCFHGDSVPWPNTPLSPTFQCNCTDWGIVVLASSLLGDTIKPQHPVSLLQLTKAFPSQASAK
jgi:hypothetical protein